MYLDIHQQHTFELNDFIGERIAVLGISGSGKTNTVAVIIESLIESLPMTIIDIEGEYWGLKAQFNIVVAGGGTHANLPLTEANAATLARWSHENRVSVILDLSETHEDEMFYIVQNYLQSLWDVSRNKQPYMLVVEECHEFMPQNGKNPVKDLITRIAKRGRKRGIGVILSSQRSASVDKNILTQAGLFFLHRVTHPIEINVYKGLIPLPARDVNDKVPALKPGQAILVRGHNPARIHIKQRQTFHAGYTPGLSATEVPSLRTLSPDLLDSLKSLMKSTSAPVRNPADELKLLQSKLEEAQTTIKKQAEEIQRLCTQIESLSAPVQTMLPLVIDEDTRDERIEANKKRAIGRQRSNFNRIIRQLKTLSKMQLIVLSFLLDNPDRQFTLDDIATHTGYNADAIRVPTMLTKLDLVKREKVGVYTRYQSIADESLSQIFPDLESSNLLEEIHALSK